MSPYGTFSIIQPDRLRVTYEIVAPVLTIGSNPQNSLTLSHPDVAAFHARLEWRQGHSVIVDVSGASNLYVNNTRVREQALRQGDVVKIGQHFLVFHPPGNPSGGTPATGPWPSGAVAPVAASPPPAASPVAGGSGAVPPFSPPQAGSGVYPQAGSGVAPQAGSGAYAPAGSGAYVPAGGVPPRPPGPPPGAAPMSPTPTHLPSVVSGGVSQQRLQSNQVVRIGRDPANTIPLNSLQASRFHAELLSQNGQFAIRDLGSTNGTFVNGHRIPPHTPVQLQRGTLIKISEFSFYFDGQQLEHYSEEGNARLDAINLRRVVAGGQLLLRDISLSIQPREFVAVVGGSGAGKSTLVNALSGFRPADQGMVLLNGLDYYANLEAFRTALGYVPQDDIIHPELTAYRALHYAAKLRMPDDVNPQEREGRIQEVLRDLHLTERRDVPVSSLSGGQRKRVSIGVELLTRPRLFFLDEPTSGLDPGMEHEAMKIFRALADQGHTMILITHATTNIMLCDKIAFLARGGYLAFFGPPKEALQYFSASDFTEIYTKVDNQKSPEQWDAEFKASPYYQRHVVSRLSEVQALMQQARANPQASLPAAVRTPVRQGSSQRQFQILMERYLDIIGRDRINLAILLAQAPVLAGILLVLVMGKQSLFTDVVKFQASMDPELMKKVPELLGNIKIVLFLLSLFSLMCGTINSVREVVKELPIYKRERAVNLRIAPYLLSKFVVLAGISAFQSAVLVGLVFSYLEKPNTDNFLAGAFLALFMVNLAGVAIGLAVSSSVPNQNIAITLLPVVLLTQIVLAGILSPLTGGVKGLLPPLTTIKWGFGMLGHLVGAASWHLDADKFPPSTWDVSLMPGESGFGGVVALAVYIIAALWFASYMLAQRDKRKD